MWMSLCSSYTWKHGNVKTYITRGSIHAWTWVTFIDFSSTVSSGIPCITGTVVAIPCIMVLPKLNKSCDHHVIKSLWWSISHGYYMNSTVHTWHTTQWPCTLQGEEAQASRWISQWLPVKPVLQVQEKVSCPFVHVPPFWHGLERHWFKSISQSFPYRIRNTNSEGILFIGKWDLTSTGHSLFFNIGVAWGLKNWEWPGDETRLMLCPG